MAVLLLGTDGSMAAQSAATLPKGTNTISGRLIDGRDDRPIAGAVITLTGYMSDGRLAALGISVTLDSPTYTAQRVMTGNDGRFFFRDLPQGRFTISADAFGYLANTFPHHWMAVVDDDRPASAVVRLWKASSISGVVTDERGEPVVGVRVSALRRQVIDEKLTLDVALQAATDDRGRFRLAPLRQGSYLVAALSASSSLPASVASEWDASTQSRTAASQLRSQLSRGGMFLETGGGLHAGGFIVQQPGPPPVLSTEGKLLAYSSTFYLDTRQAEAASAVTLESGEARDDINLSVEYSTTVRVSGTAAGPDGPAKYLTVRLTPTGMGGSAAPIPPGSFAALTDAAGSFTYAGVPAAEYELTASFSKGSDIDGEMFWSSQRVIVGEKDVSGVDVALEHGITVTGRVEFQSGRGAVRPDLATVGLRPIGATSWGGMVPGSVRPDGTFKVAVGRLGASELYVSVAPSAWWWVGTSIGGKPLADGIVMVTAQGVRDLLLTVSDAPPKLVGTTADERGAPDASAEVIVFPADTAMWRQGMFHSQRVRSTPVTSAGSFEIAGLPSGVYYVAAVPEQGATDWMTTPFLERLAAVATTVTLRTGEVGSVALKTITQRKR